jgi:hypothetical protein
MREKTGRNVDEHGKLNNSIELRLGRLRVNATTNESNERMKMKLKIQSKQSAASFT